MDTQWIDDIENKDEFWVESLAFPQGKVCFDGPCESGLELALRGSLGVPIEQAPGPEGFEGRPVYDDPYIVKLYNILTKEECERLIELASGKFKRSTMLIGDKLKHNPRRTSQTAMITENGCADKPYSEEVITNIIRRVCALVGCSYRQIEGLMVVKYEVGEEFKEHVDYFDEENVSAISNGGQRIATFFVWLNDMEEEDGGATLFTDLGLMCIPEQGSGLFWWNQRGDKLLTKTKHCGAPVQKGTKYGMNIWIRYPGWI